jgi:hypothetical protein
MVNPRNLEQEDILDFIDQWLEDQNETTEITKTVAFTLEEHETEQATESEKLEKSEQHENSENLEKSEKLEINDLLGSAVDLLKPSKESHEPKTPKKALDQWKTPKKSCKFSTVAKLTSAMKRTNSEKGRTKSTDLATISEGRLARAKSLKTKKESTKIRMAKSLVTNLIIDQATAQKFGLPIGYVGKEMDEIDASDQKFSMFEAAIAADLAYYQRSSSDREGRRSRVSSIGDDSVFSGDRQDQLILEISVPKQWFYSIYSQSCNFH